MVSLSGLQLCKMQASKQAVHCMLEPPMFLTAPEASLRQSHQTTMKPFTNTLLN